MSNGLGAGSGINSKIALFKRRLLVQIGTQAVQEVRPATRIASKTLGASVTWIIPKGRASFKQRVVQINVPHYWARWLHDGRKQISMPKQAIIRNPTGKRGFGKPLIWFGHKGMNLRNLDPRHPQPWPVTRSQWRPLTAVEFKAAVAMKIISIQYEVGETQGKFFFTRPLQDFASRMRSPVRQAITKFLRKHVVLRDRAVARLTL